MKTKRTSDKRSHGDAEAWLALAIWIVVIAAANAWWHLLIK